jgi:hypothetical protein
MVGEGKGRQNNYPASEVSFKRTEAARERRMPMQGCKGDEVTLFCTATPICTRRIHLKRTSNPLNQPTIIPIVTTTMAHPSFSFSFSFSLSTASPSQSFHHHMRHHQSNPNSPAILPVHTTYTISKTSPDSPHFTAPHRSASLITYPQPTSTKNDSSILQPHLPLLLLLYSRRAWCSCRHSRRPRRSHRAGSSHILGSIPTAAPTPSQ